MQKEKSVAFVKYCLAFLIVAGAFVFNKQTSYATMCPSCGGMPTSDSPVEVSPPTCSSYGMYEYTCVNDPTHKWSIPGGSKNPDNHNVLSWTVTKQPTETEEGLEEGVCDWCGLPQTRTIARLPASSPVSAPSSAPPPEPTPDPEPEPEPAITEETPSSTSTEPKKKREKKEETVSEDNIEEPVEEKNPWEGEEFYIDPETREKVFRITGAVIGGAVAIGILRALVLSVKARKARAAAKAAEAALKKAATEEAAEAAESEFEKPEIEFEIKTILACLTDSEENKAFTKFLSRKKYIKLETAGADERESLAESLDDYEAELFIFDVASQEDVDSIRELIKSIKEEDKYMRVSILVKGSEYKSLKSSLDELKAAHEIEGYASDAASADSKLVNLVLPVYKPKCDGDSVLGYMASVADALGIPYVSEAIEYFSTGKEIVEALKSDDLEMMDRVSLIGNIASVLGIDKVVEVTDFIDKVSEAKEIICGNETEEAEEIENS